MSPNYKEDVLYWLDERPWLYAVKKDSVVEYS